MRVRRLGWAGIELEESGSRIAIDAITTLGFFDDFHGPTDLQDQLVAPKPRSLDAVLLTHLHRDHADPAAIADALAEGGVVAGPARPESRSPHQRHAVEPQEAALAALGIERTALSPGDSLNIGPFEAIACPSVDGLGAAQIAWLVRTQGGEGGSILHCGDTLWHGGFWEIKAEHGAPDVACLPANGVIVDFPFNQPAAEQAADLDPEGAVAAATALAAGRLMPIHFSRTYEHETMYRPTNDVPERLRTAADARGLELDLAPIGSWQSVRRPDESQPASRPGEN